MLKQQNCQSDEVKPSTTHLSAIYREPFNYLGLSFVICEMGIIILRKELYGKKKKGKIASDILCGIDLA